MRPLHVARESGITPGEPEDRLCARLASVFVQARSHASSADVAHALDTSTQPSDVLVFIGAGDVNEIAFSLLRPALVGSPA